MFQTFLYLKLVYQLNVCLRNVVLDIFLFYCLLRILVRFDPQRTRIIVKRFASKQEYNVSHCCKTLPLRKKNIAPFFQAKSYRSNSRFLNLILKFCLCAHHVLQQVLQKAFFPLQWDGCLQRGFFGKTSLGPSLLLSDFDCYYITKIDVT